MASRTKRSASAAPARTFRRARSADLDRVLEIHLTAYPDDRSVVARERAFVQHPFGGLAHVVVAEEDGVVAAQALLLPLRSAFGGRAVAVSGIASLAVAPERRGRGLATSLMTHLHSLADARGDVLTLLYAFRQGFYARLGYATTASRKRLAIDTRSIPRTWGEVGRRVRPATGRDRPAIQRAYLRALGRSSGWLVRTPRTWEQLFSRERLVFLVVPAEGAGVGGYVAFVLEKAHAHAETIAVVEELVADDGAARRALLGALGGLRDQVSEVHLEVAEDDPLERALVDPDGRRWGSDAVEHGLGEIVGGPMIRIEDIGRALEARGYPASGTFDVVVQERAASADEPVLAAGVRVSGGRAEVGPARGGGALTTTRAGLAAIFYGGLELDRAVGLGLATVDPRVAARVAAIARVAPMGPIDAF